MTTSEHERSPEAARDERSLAPDSILGRYRLVRPIGHGASGEVFEAHDPVLGRAVALKVLRGRWSPSASLRLQREAHALARVSHPNVVQIYEIGVDQGRIFIAMELVRGRTLDRWREAGPSWRECVAVYRQAGAGLAAAHEAGIVHRDFKPHNCILGEDGRVRVLDFGLAREPGSAGSSGLGTTLSHDVDQPLTATGAVMGTLAYMPLEQMEGRPATAASDQFAFCASLFEALHGHRPFRGSSREVLIEALRTMTVEPSDGDRLPAALRRVLMRGLGPDPAERWASMPELLAALATIERGRSRRWALGLGGGVVVLGSVGAWLWLGQPSRPGGVTIPEGVPPVVVDARSLSPSAQRLRAQAEDAWAADRLDELRLALDRLAPQADGPLDDPSLAAEALLWRGRLLDESDPQALETFRRAFFLAHEADVPSTAARAALGAASVIVEEHGHAFDEWMRHAWEELHRGPWDRSAAVEVLVSSSYGRAVVLADEQAVDLLDLAAATIGDVEPDDGPFMASSMVELATAWRFVDEPERGLRWAQRAAALIEATAGPDHPVLAAAEAEIGSCTNELGPCYLGLPHLERARAAQLAAADGAIDWRSAIVVQHIAECLEELGRYEVALEEYRRMVAYWAELGDEYRSREVDVRISIARLLAHLGRTAEAEREYERAIAFVDPSGPEDSLRELAREELEELRARVDAR